MIAVGRNYAEHAKELGNAVPTKPVLFLKPVSSFLLEGKGPIEIPHDSKELHHEGESKLSRICATADRARMAAVELGVVIGKGGRDIPVASARSHIAGYFLGLDMTGRVSQR